MVYVICLVDWLLITLLVLSLRPETCRWLSAKNDEVRWNLPPFNPSPWAPFFFAWLIQEWVTFVQDSRGYLDSLFKQELIIFLVRNELLFIILKFWTCKHWSIPSKIIQSEKASNPPTNTSITALDVVFKSRNRSPNDSGASTNKPLPKSQLQICLSKHPYVSFLLLKERIINPTPTSIASYNPLSASNKPSYSNSNLASSMQRNSRNRNCSLLSIIKYRHQHPSPRYRPRPLVT